MYNLGIKKLYFIFFHNIFIFCAFLFYVKNKYLIFIDLKSYYGMLLFCIYFSSAVTITKINTYDIDMLVNIVIFYTHKIKFFEKYLVICFVGHEEQ